MTLQIKNICKSFGNKVAVENVSFDIEPGQVYGLLGLNGAGKSTTLRMILDILEPDSGQILWKGQPVRTFLPGGFGYLPEERGLYQQMKVLPHLVLFGRMQGMSRVDATAAAVKWLHRFEMDFMKDSLISSLSKGNQQKVQFICAVLHEPDLLILDEPFSGLDPVNTSLFKSVFQELSGQRKTILFSSHRLDHVEELSQSVAILHQSSLVLEGTVDEILLAQPAVLLRVGGDVPAIRAYLPAGAILSEFRGLLTVQCAALEDEGKTLLPQLVQAGIAIQHFESVRPTLNDVFLQKVGRGV
jgi:ABC-2 type transport system ATP-binding protein